MIERKRRGSPLVRISLLPWQLPVSQNLPPIRSEGLLTSAPSPLTKLTSGSAREAARQSIMSNLGISSPTLKRTVWRAILSPASPLTRMKFGLGRRTLESHGWIKSQVDVVSLTEAMVCSTIEWRQSGLTAISAGSAQSSVCVGTIKVQGHGQVMRNI